MVETLEHRRELTTPTTLHRKQGSSHCNIEYATSLYQRHGMCFDTIFVSDMFYSLDGAKIRSFLETTKHFSRKFHFISNFSPKNLRKSIFCYTFALEQ